RLAGSGGNWENGFLVEVTDERARPGFWTEHERHPPVEFDASRREDEGAATSGGTRLSVRFWWDRAEGEIWWEGRAPSTELVVEDRGTMVFTRAAIEPKRWLSLSSEESE